jgi:hypothetical protein
VPTPTSALQTSAVDAVVPLAIEPLALSAKFPLGNE